MKIFKWFVWGSLTLLTAGGLYVASTRSQDILDWWRLRDYVAPASIQALAVDSGMNAQGKKLFYVHKPELLDKTTFSSSCVVGEQTIVLGCYISHQNIYLYDVDDVRLHGVEEVTAAHEMLHAAFDRLSPEEQDAIGELLIDTFNSMENERIEKTVRTYEQQDSTVVVNELHSILGTEVRDLPAVLEKHYSKYFENRAKVVDLADAYAAEFERRESEIETYDERLGEIQSEISRREANLTSQADVLKQERSRLESLKSNPEAYNALVDGFNAKVRQYNNDLQGVKNLIETYNTIVQERNAIALEEKELVQAIDTRVDPLQ